VTLDVDVPEGPRYRCQNSSCPNIKPKTTVHESERKTLYRCPVCRHILHANWNDEAGGSE